MKIAESNRLELHYFFSDTSHGFDATVRNESERELLGLFRDIAGSLDIRIWVESEPPKQGGFIEIWNFIGASAQQITLIVSLIAILLSRFPVANKKLTKLQIENLELENQKKKLELIKLIQESSTRSGVDRELVRKVIDHLNLSYKLTWRRSNFFKNLIKYKRINKISTQRYLDDYPVAKAREIKKASFSNFILDSDDLPDIIIDEAEIDLISPVLIPGKFRWKGFYKKEIISFEMLDGQFSKMVQRGEIRLKNKFSIIVKLQQSRKIDENGLIKSFGSKVLMVIEYSVNGEVILTENGKKHREA